MDGPSKAAPGTAVDWGGSAFTENTEQWCRVCDRNRPKCVPEKRINDCSFGKMHTSMGITERSRKRLSMGGMLNE
jgi:hypothetical protein